MGQSSADDMDNKLDALLSRIQTLSGDDSAAPSAPAERPKQQPRRAAAAPQGGPPPAAKRPQSPAPPPRRQAPAAAKKEAQAASSMLGFEPNRDEPWRPEEPKTLADAGINESLLEAIVYRYLLNCGEAEGRKIADQVKLPFRMIEPLVTRLKMEQHVAYKSATATNDYVYVLTETGRAIARNHQSDCTYYGACPVTLYDYISSVKRQTIEGQYPKKKDLLKAFQDLLINPKMLNKLGPAVASGRGMFLFGFPGNGKTSIAERVTGAFGKYVWIPSAIEIDGDVLRVYDPMNHELAMPEAGSGLLDIGGYDKTLGPRRAPNDRRRRGAYDGDAGGAVQHRKQHQRGSAATQE